MPNSQNPPQESPSRPKDHQHQSQSIKGSQSRSKRQQIPGSQTQQQSIKSKSIVIETDKKGNAKHTIIQESSVKKKITLYDSKQRSQPHIVPQRVEQDKQNTRNFGNNHQIGSNIAYIISTAVNSSEFKTPQDRQPPKVQTWPSSENNASDADQLEDKVSEMNEQQKIEEVIRPKASWFTIVPQDPYLLKQPLASKKAPYDLPIPREQYGHQGQQQQKNNQISFVLDEKQKRITDYVSQDSLKGRKKQPQYKIVVKQATPQKQSDKRSSFYKNNDIYGVQNFINQSKVRNQKAQQRNNNGFVPDLQIDDPSPPNHLNQNDRIPDLQIDGPQIVELPERDAEQTIISRNNLRNQYNNDSNITNRRSEFMTNQSTQAENQNKLQIEGNIIIHNITQSQSQRFQNNWQQDIQIDRENRTDSKKKSQTEVTFWYTKNKDVIYTQECYKQPLSGRNKRALVTQRFQVIEQAKSQRLQVGQNEPSQKSIPSDQMFESVRVKRDLGEKPKNQNIDTIERRKTHPPSRTIFYRQQDQLNLILDFFDLREQINDDAQTKSKKFKISQNKQREKKEQKQPNQNQDIDIDAKPQQNDFKIIRKTQMQGLANIEEQQLDVNQAPFLVDRPHPVFLSAQQSSFQASSQAKSVNRKKTTRKQFIKATATGKSNQNMSKSSFRSKQKGQISQKKGVSFKTQPTGSLFHYELIPSRNSDRKSLVQVRRSGRLYSKSKAKMLKDMQKVYEQQEAQQKQLQNEKRQTTNSKSKQKKPTTQNKALSKSRVRSEQQEVVTLDWLKQHLESLNFIVIQKDYMYEDYNAMTQKDVEISNYLIALGQQAQMLKKQRSSPMNNHQPENQSHDYEQDENKNQVRQNQMMRKIKNNQSKGKKKQSKSVHKKTNRLTVNENKPKTKNKIQMTLNISIRPQNQKEQQDQFPQQNTHFQEHDQDHQERRNQQKQEEQLENKNYERMQNNNSASQKLRVFNQNKQKYKIPDELPITVDYIVDPDILNFGIYALVKLGRLAQFQLGTKYAITPICELRFARKKNVLLVLDESRKLVPQEYSDNIAWIALNTKLTRMIQQANGKKKNSHNEKQNAEKGECQKKQQTN